MSLQLQIETTNVCMADCVFCPYGTMQRKKGTMALDLYKRLIDEAATIPQIERITLTGLGETLLDRHLVSRIAYTRQVLGPTIGIDIYTNGNLLRPATTDALIDAGLDVLYVSLNAATPEKRQEIMHLDDYAQVVGYVQYAVQAFQRKAEAEGQPSLTRERWRVIVKAIGSKDLMEVGEHEQFLHQWGGEWNKGGAAYLHLEGNWAGATGMKMRTRPKAACHRALTQIMVLWDGRVSLCCFDGEGQVILGDLNHQTIREVYNGQKALGIREAHVNGKRGDLELCCTCTAI